MELKVRVTNIQITINRTNEDNKRRNPKDNTFGFLNTIFRFFVELFNKWNN